MSEQSEAGRRVRVWPLLLLIAALVAVLAWIWTDAETVRQEKVIATIFVSLVAVVGGIVWLLLLSGMSWRTRLTVFAVVAAAGLLARLSLRIEGVDGDMVPILGWRWASEPAISAAAEPPPDASPSAGLLTGSFPEFLGPDRDAVISGVRLDTDWEVREPTFLWRRPIGEGWSGFAVDRGLAVTLSQEGAQEVVAAYRLETGEEVWRHTYEARYFTVIAGAGPRSVPTIHNRRVFAAGATGVLNCLDLETGRLLWQRQVLDENGGRVPSWGMSVSPLLVDDLVVVSTGGSAGRALVSYAAATGEPVWSAGDGSLSYASPQLNVLAGVHQIVMFNGGSVAGHAPKDGALLWEQPWPAGQPNVAQPLQVADDQLVVSAGYGMGSKSFRIRAEGDHLTAGIEWETPRMKSKFSNLVFHDGFVYGIDDGIMACLDPTTGKLKWKRGRFTHSQLLLVGEVLLVWTETSELIAVDPDPEGLRELARIEVFEDRNWNPPALAGQLLLLRNHREAAALVLPLANDE